MTNTEQIAAMAERIERLEEALLAAFDALDGNNEHTAFLILKTACKALWHRRGR